MENFRDDAPREDISLGSFAPGIRHRAFPPVALPLGVAALYFVAAKLCAELAFPSAPIAAFWAPNAILLAALIVTPQRRWWAYLAAVLPFHFAAELPTAPLLQVLIQYVLNSAEAVLGAWAQQRFAAQPRCFDRVRTTVVLIVFGATLAPLVTSVLTAEAFASLGILSDPLLMIVARTITNAFAVVALVPLLVHAFERMTGGRREIAIARTGGAALLTLCLAAVAFFVFAYPASSPHPAPVLLYAPLPFLIWAAIRFGTAGACATSLLLGAFSMWGVLNGHGPFITQDPVHNILSVVTFQAGTAMALLTLASFLEERKLEAHALRASEARFGNIFQNNIVPTLIWRGDFRTFEANAALRHLLALSDSDLRDGSAKRAQLEAWCRELGGPHGLKTDDRFGPVEKELELDSGRRVPVMVAVSRFPADLGGAALYVMDLSESRRAEARQRMAEGLHAAVLASLNDQVAILDTHGVVIEINDSWRRFAETKPPPRFDCVLPGESFRDACAAAARAGDPAAAEELESVQAVLDRSEVRRLLELSEITGAQPRWFEISIEQLRHQEGGAVVTRTDITSRKRAELEARNQRQQLAHLGRAAVLGQLSGAFAHELNQPLTSILGNAEAALSLLSHNSIDLAEINYILRDIVRDDMRAAQVIQRLRALLRKEEILRQPVNLNMVIHDVLQLARSELITRNVCVTTHPDARLPPVMADRVQMQQVILNLLMNACEAMKGMLPADRRLALSTMLSPEGDSVEVTVADSGCGIPTGEVERIFQPFVTTKSDGMGLGLAICRSVAEAHRGRLWAENTKQGGAVFRLRLPIEGGLCNDKL